MSESQKEIKSADATHSKLPELTDIQDQHKSKEQEQVNDLLKSKESPNPSTTTIEDLQDLGATKNMKEEQVESIPVFHCPLCKEERSSLIQCMKCGDRQLDTEALTPYQRLLLKPRPLYTDTMIQGAKEKLLIMFHPLKASRLNAHWSLKQRALICRDAVTLQSISGALITYTKYLKLLSLEYGSSITNVHDIDYHQTLSQNNSGKLWSLTQKRGFSKQLFNPQLYLLKSAFAELQEYDSYQEREKLFNHGMRSILNKARSIAKYLHLYNFQEPQLNLDELMFDLHALQEQEVWLEGQRLYQPLKVKHDIAL